MAKRTIMVEAEIQPAKAPRVGGRAYGLNPKLTKSDITQALGFPPNTVNATAGRYSGDGKVTMQWDFTVAGKTLSIWDYKGSRWSANGDQAIMRTIFGDDNVTD